MLVIRSIGGGQSVDVLEHGAPAVLKSLTP